MLVYPPVNQFLFGEKNRVKHRDDPSHNKLSVPEHFLMSRTEWRESVDNTKAQTGRNVCRDSLVTHYLLLLHAAVHLLLRRDTSHLLEEEEEEEREEEEKEEEEREEEEEGLCCENAKSRVFSFGFLVSLKDPSSSSLPPFFSPSTHVVPNVFPVQASDLFPHCVGHPSDTDTRKTHPAPRPTDQTCRPLQSDT